MATTKQKECIATQSSDEYVCTDGEKMKLKCMNKCEIILVYLCRPTAKRPDLPAIANL